MDKRRVVITGLGVVAPTGIGKKNFWQACIHGQSGVDKITSFDTSDFDCHIAGQVKHFNPSLYIPSQIVNKIDRFVHLGLSASLMAIADSLLDFNQENKNKIGVIIGSGFGGFIFQEEQVLDAMLTGKSRLNPLCVPKITPNAVSSHIAILYGLLGPNLVITSSFASGTQAIGEAFRKIQHSEIDVCITGGAEAPLTRFVFGACCGSGVVSKRNNSPKEASRPFDRLRDGYVIAEGAGILILEELGHALKRKAPIYAEVKGYAANFSNCFEPDAVNMSGTINRVLLDASLDSSRIDYINASANSTPSDDIAETKAIKQVFATKPYSIPISSTKSMIGHSIGAAGAIEAVACALAIQHQFVPANINYKEKDPLCDLDYVSNQGREIKIDNVLLNSFGFDHSNTCLVLSILD